MNQIKGLLTSSWGGSLSSIDSTPKNKWLIRSVLAKSHRFHKWLLLKIETFMNNSIMLTNLNSEQIGVINTVGVNGIGDTAAQP